jgi:hypothetical protein
MSATLIAQTFDGCVTCGKREADPYHRPCALRDDRTADGWNTLTHAHHHPFTRPATESDPSVVASDADTFNVEPSPDAPTHTGEDQAVEEGGKTVSSPHSRTRTMDLQFQFGTTDSKIQLDGAHSSGRCKCAAFGMIRMQQLGEIIGWRNAMDTIRAAVTNPEALRQINLADAREFPALFGKLSSGVAE